MLQRPFYGGWVFRLETGESIPEAIVAFCEQHSIAAGTFSGIGAIQWARLGYYNQEAGDYVDQKFDRELEVVSLTGNISRKSDGTLFAHTHCVLSGADMQVVGGHLFEAVVGPTLEVYLWTIPGEIRRTTAPDRSLELIDL